MGWLGGRVTKAIQERLLREAGCAHSRKDGGWGDDSKKEMTDQCKPCGDCRSYFKPECSNVIGVCD